MAESLMVYEKWLAAFNDADWDEFAAQLTPNARFTFTHLMPDDRATLDGRDRFVASFQGWRSGFSQLKGEITDTIVTSDRSAVMLWWTGTTVGGRSVGFASCHWVGVEGDRIVEMIDFFDEKGYDAQMGR